MDDQMFMRLWNWAKRRHRNKGKVFIATKYWRLETDQWTFGVKDGPTLFKHSATPIKRHTKVRGIKSPYDGDWLYWATRMGKDPLLPLRIAKLLKKQKGKCAECGHYFLPGDIIENDHILAKVLGGK
jgi:RNA-directed DNA polymerase